MPTELRLERTPDPRAWFDEGDGMPPVLPGNDVTYLIDGELAFREMTAAMLAANAPGDFIYIVNWFCDVDFPLARNAEEKTAPTLRARRVALC